MILVAYLLGSLGIADLARTRVDGARRLWLPAALGIVAFGGASLGSGQAWWWAPIAAAAIMAWLLCTRERGTRETGTGETGAPKEGAPARGLNHRAGYWALGGLAAVVAAAFAWGSALPTAAGPLVDWYEALPYAALDGVGFVTFALATGAALFLVESGNVAVRLALRGERFAVPAVTAGALPSGAGAVAATSTPRRRWWHRTPPEPRPKSEPEPQPQPFTELKGGRFIGPLERLFLLALLVTGDYTALAAVIAAKGIVRFPEISKDAPGGSKAEYFLVGSFASWALVALASLLILLGPTIT